MRTIQEFRAMKLDSLWGAIRRPGMYGHDAPGVEFFLMGVLGDLCFIDEREAEYGRARELMQERGQITCQGVVSGFCRRVSTHGQFNNGVASVYALVAHHLGYIPWDKPLSSTGWRGLLKGLRMACRERDWRVGEIIERFGEPSLSIGTVLVYGPKEAEAGWVFFDFDAASSVWPDSDYLLRDVRIPAGRFVREFTFSPHGRRLRIGG